MVIYIADNQKLEKFKLPEKIEESFLFKYVPNTGNSEYFINIFANDNKWFFKNSDNITLQFIETNQIETNTVLEVDKYYKLSIEGCNSNPILFCRNEYSENYKVFATNVYPITIGNSSENTIDYGNRLTLANHLSINFENETWSLVCNNDINSFAYVNNVRVKQAILKRGDTIFINGMLIIWMGEFIKICDINQKIRVTKLDIIDLPKQKNDIKSTLDKNLNLKLYNDDEYFYHRPIIKNIIAKKVITIDSPPSAQEVNEIPFLISFGTRITMIAFSGISFFNAYEKYQQTNKISSCLTSIIMGSAMLIGTLIMPTISNIYMKKVAKKKEKFRQKKYTKYLDKKVKEIELEMKQEQQIMLENAPNVKECYEIVTTRKNLLWSREINDADFLTIRLGLGNLPPSFIIEAPEEHFELYEDNLLNNVFNIKENSKSLKSVPIVTSLTKNFISALICEDSFKFEYINSLMIQIMAFHSSKDLKIILFSSKSNEKKWDYLKGSAHCINDDKSIRYFATSLEDMKTISIELEQEFNKRKELFENNQIDAFGDDIKDLKIKAYKNFDSYYLIIIDNYKDAKAIQLINDIMMLKSNLGFSILFVSNNIQELPNSCNNFIYITNTSGSILEKEISKDQQQTFIPEYDSTMDMYNAIYRLANIPIAENNGLELFPQSISFLEMYNVGKIEQLNILNRWQTNSSINSLEVPIGVQQNGDLFKLDLHEKHHGPHGLIAGSTGSGKSEFIISYILSMAINYHPDYVQSVLIDYKGGGLAGAFENRETGLRIPHLAGTITNLDSSEINRTLVSIESELKRRQEKFNEVRDQLGESTIDIYKYQRLYREGAIKEPIPHLFIISDEFAELKAQQPDFMNQLVSTSRIGRSLGVHLILATQKPSGVVNDQIWSNSRFKICLKVQSRQDSMEMLKREEASEIKEIGRFYLQVGYNELFEQGQSAWCGAKYIPSDKIIKKQDNSIEFIDNIGETVKKIDDVVKVDIEYDYGDQLTNIVKYIENLAIKENIKTTKLWLDPLAEEIMLLDLQKKYNFTAKPYCLNALIGEYDSPDNQSQGPAVIDFTKKGGLIIYGEINGGKENLIYTIITSLSIMHTPEEINFYLVDYASETMKKFNKLPHVGDVMYSDDTEKLFNLLKFIEEEIDERKKLFENYMGSYLTYNNESGNKLPQIIVAIAGFDILIDTNNKIYDRLYSLFRDCNKYGIYFVIATTASSAIKYRASQLFENKICLHLADPNEYIDLIGAPRRVFPNKKFGRGLISVNEKIKEFQTAILCQPEMFNKTILDYSKKASEIYKNHAKKIRVLPNNLLVKNILEDNEVNSMNKVPIGIRKYNLETLNYDFSSHPILPIITNFLDEEFDFIYGLIEEFMIIPNVKVRIIDLLNIFNKEYKDVPVYKNNFDTIIQQIDMELDKEQTTTRNTIFIFVGIGKISNQISAEYYGFVNRIFAKVSASNKNSFLLVDNYISYKNIESERWYTNYIDRINGIWLGDGVSNQVSIKIAATDYGNKELVFKDMAYLILNSKGYLFKHIIDEEDKEDE